MSPKPSFWLDSIFIYDSKATIVFVLWVMVTRKFVRNGAYGTFVLQCTYPAKLKVWKVFNHPWSALPRSVLRRGTSFMKAEDENVLE